MQSSYLPADYGLACKVIIVDSAEVEAKRGVVQLKSPAPPSNAPGRGPTGCRAWLAYRGWRPPPSQEFEVESVGFRVLAIAHFSETEVCVALTRPQPLGASVAPYVFHLALDDLAEEHGCVDDVSVARVDADVG